MRLAHSGGMFAFADGPRIGLSLPLPGDVPEVVPPGAPDVVAPRVPDVVAPVVPDVVAPVAVATKFLALPALAKRVW